MHYNMNDENLTKDTMASKTRTITMDDEHHRKGRIIAAIKKVDNMSALFRYFIDKEWNENFTSNYKNFSLEETPGQE